MEKMPRQKTISGIEAKIKQAEDNVVKAKGRYDHALSKLEALIKEKQHMQDLEMLALYKKSGKSFDAVKRYLTDSSRL